jgi:hypothetical protein
MTQTCLSLKPFQPVTKENNNVSACTNHGSNTGENKQLGSYGQSQRRSPRRGSHYLNYDVLEVRVRFRSGISNDVDYLRDPIFGAGANRCYWDFGVYVASWQIVTVS